MAIRNYQNEIGMAGKTGFSALKQGEFFMPLDHAHSADLFIVATANPDNQEGAGLALCLSDSRKTYSGATDAAFPGGVTCVTVDISVVSTEA